MAKKLASKATKKLVEENKISEEGLNKDYFTPTWQGRIIIIDVNKSEIAQKLSIKEKGEYAIKIR